MRCTTPVRNASDDEQREVARGSTFLEQPQAGTRGCGVDEQMQFVEQPGVEQLSDDRHRSAQRDSPHCGVVLERGGGLDEIALQLLGVAPGELQRAAGRDDLPHVAQVLGHDRVFLARGFPVGPGSGETVVGDAAEEHDIGVVRLADGLAHLVVEVRKVPIPDAGIDNAVERDEHAGRDRCHRMLLS